MTKIIAVANQKGGVGKTTTTVNLATALSTIDKKVLIIDLDPQGNASTGLGIDQTERAKNNIYSLFLGQSTPNDTVRATAIPRLYVIPSTHDLSGFSVEMAQIPNREYLLREIIYNEFSAFDYVIIDTPPTLGLLPINALTASDSVIIPTQCEFYAMEGLAQLFHTIELVKEHLNPPLEIEGIVLTMLDKRSNLSHQVEEEVRRYFKDLVFKTVIPRNVKVSEAPSHGKPVLLYSFSCPGSQAYIQLAKEVLELEKRSRYESV